jgi:hypothetical protein
MLADDIRRFAYTHFIEPEIRAGRREAWVRAGDVHAKMGLQNRMPAVCGALDGRAFRERYALDLALRDGPPLGANARYCFRNAATRESGIAAEVPASIAILNDAVVKRARVAAPVALPATAHGTVCLVSCVKAKKPTSAAAKELYVSNWFRLARRYVESLGCPWYILSAKHGLVAPNTVIDPYEVTLNNMGVAERMAWSARVVEAIEKQIPNSGQVVVLAGARYREFLMDDLRRRAAVVTVPLEGLRIGEQLSWLNRHAAHG